MLNISIINQFASTPDLAGHSRQYDIASYLSSKGCKIRVYSSDFSLSQRKFTKLTKNQIIKMEIIENIEWYWLKVIPYKKNNLRRIFNLISFCFNLISILTAHSFIKNKKPDLIYASSPQLPAAFISLLFAKFINIPFIFEVRDLWPQVLIDQGSGNRENFLIRILKIFEIFLYKNSNHIFVLSENAIKYIKERGGRKITFLPNGPELKFFKYYALPKEINGFNLGRPFKILYTGAHGESNDLKNVLDAAKILDELPIEFNFIGDGTEKEKLQDYAKNFKNVNFFDPIPKTEIPSILATSDAIILSLKNIQVFKYGISPNKLYDAYAIGRPVISTVEGSINDEIRKYKVGVTCKGEDPRILSETIKELFYLPRKNRIQMSKNARLLSEQKYSREIINKKIYEIINNLIF